MRINIFESAGVPASQQRKRHLLTLALAIMIGWILWYLASARDFADLDTVIRFHELMEDLWQTALETAILFEAAILYSKIIIKALWNRPHTYGRLVLQCVILLTLNFLSAALVGWIYTLFYPSLQNTGSQFKIMFCDGITVYFSTSIFFMSYLFNRHRDEAEHVIRAENALLNIRTVELQTKLDKLALQTNNHFIFNCFSTLSSLINESPEEAGSFLQGLTNIYRYLVQNGERHIVPVSEEMGFTMEYIRLTSWRYTGVKVNIEGDSFSITGFILPVSVQLLVENAIKHNRRTKDNPLTIKIILDTDYITVSNPILKLNNEAPSTRTGLKTLQERFRVLTDRTIDINNDGEQFSVTLPILYDEDLI